MPALLLIYLPLCGGMEVIMKKPVFLIGAIVWAVISIIALTALVIGLSGKSLSNSMPAWLKFDSFSGIFSANTPLVKEESFSLAEIGELDISTQYQSIRITLNSGNELTVRQYDLESARLFSSETSGNKLNINIPSRYLASISMANPRLEIDLPRGYAKALKLASSSGSINLDGYIELGSTSISSSSGTVRLNSGLKCGDLSISTSSGSIHLGNTEASSININSSSGTLRLDELRADEGLILKSNSGSIHLGSTQASSINIRSASGSLHLDKLQAAADILLKSTSGSISSEDITAKSFTADSNSGTLRLGNIGVTDQVNISTSSASQNLGHLQCETFTISSNSGSLRYDGISGTGNIDSSSGSISCNALDVRGDVSIKSTSGTQRITLAPEQNFEINISVSSGSIRASSLSLYYSDSNGKKAFGTVGNGGDRTLDLRSSSGSINIH